MTTSTSQGARSSTTPPIQENPRVGDDTIPCADVPTEWFNPLSINEFAADLNDCQSITTIGEGQFDQLLVMVHSDQDDGSIDSILAEIELLRSANSSPPDTWLQSDAVWREYLQIQSSLDHYVFTQRMAFELDDSDVVVNAESASFVKNNWAGGHVENESYYAGWFATVLNSAVSIEMSLDEAVQVTDTLRRQLLGTPILEQHEFGPATTASSTSSDAEGFGQVRVLGTSLPLFTPGSSDDAAEGLLAPSLEGSDLRGSPIRIEADGRPKVIVFLAHWCPHCDVAVSEAAAWIEGGGKPPGVDFYAVSTFADPSRESWPPEEWLSGAGWSQPTIRDDREGSARTAYGVEVLPFWVVLDDENLVIERLTGEIGPDGLREIFTVASDS